jgi:D-sedoheptulose 7-phosphate isomerase
MNFFSKNFNQLHSQIDLIDIKFLENLTKLILKTTKNKKKIIICGNGGSAATASHVSVDLSLNGKIKAINFNEADLITCFANDFKYENWVKKSLEIYSEKGDLLILISCSGTSKNLVAANNYAYKNKINVATLTGCEKNNPLNSKKSNLRLWIDSKKYNHIEIIHHMVLLSIVDKIIYLNKN